MYAATTKDEGNDADGLFSTAWIRPDHGGHNMNDTSFAHTLFATGVPGKLFDKLRAVRFVERPHRACPVLMGWTGSFTHQLLINPMSCPTRGDGKLQSKRHAHVACEPIFPTS